MHFAKDTKPDTDSQGSIQIHIGDKQTTDTQMQKKESLNIWDTGTFKSVISRTCLEKLPSANKLQPCTGI